VRAPTDTAGDLPTSTDTEGFIRDTADTADATTVPDDGGEPVADAGRDVQIARLEQVRLDGSASYDARGLRIVAWQWSMINRPSGSTATLTASTETAPTSTCT
jgi:hypothetical protein